MKNAPSIATTDAKNTVCETGAAASAVGRCEALAPMRSHYNHVSIAHHSNLSQNSMEPRGVGETHANKQRRDRSHNRQRKRKRDSLGRRLGIVLEDVPDLRKLPVPERLLMRRHRHRGIMLDLDIEEGRYEAIGGPEGGNDDACVEGLRGGGVLDREVLLGLCAASASTKFLVRREKDVQSRRRPCRCP